MRDGMSNQFAGLPTSAAEGLAWLRDTAVRLGKYVERPFEFPQPSLKLDVRSRAPDKRRMVKHISQMCTGHVVIFVRSTQIKQVCLLDAYLAMVDAKNPVGVYAVARSCLELNAFMHEVSQRLVEAAARDEAGFQERGETFFSTIVRARFASSDPLSRKQLSEAGAPTSALKPINVMACIEGLLNVNGMSDARSRYDALCDFVHHNFSSNNMAIENTRLDTVARSLGGGEVRTTSRGAVTRFRYPPVGSGQAAIDATVAGVVRDQAATIAWLNRCPECPYTSAELVEWTGSRLGFKKIASAHGPTRASKDLVAGRNDVCPCGSGKKFKKCCSSQN